MSCRHLKKSSEFSVNKCQNSMAKKPWWFDILFWNLQKLSKILKKCWFWGLKWCHIGPKWWKILGKIVSQIFTFHRITNNLHHGFMEWFPCYSWIKCWHLQKFSKMLKILIKGGQNDVRGPKWWKTLVKNVLK